MIQDTPPGEPVELLPAEEVVVGDSPSYSIVWLHGLGADGHDFVPFVPELNLSPEPGIRFVFPHAPVRPVTLNYGMAMRAWYDIKELGSRNDDEPGIRQSARLVERRLRHEEERGTPPERTFLAGFSQGGAMALHVGLRYPKKLAGILVLSGYLLLESTLEGEATGANRKTPVLQCHGTYDPIVPVQLGQAGFRVVQSHGNPAEWKTYPVEHGLHYDEVAAVRAWLVERMS